MNRVMDAPTEWYGEAEGLVFWAWYRAGWLSWGIGSTLEKAQDDSDQHPAIVHPDIRRRHGSCMTDEDMKKALNGLVEFEVKS